MADKILATITSKGQITLPAQHRKAWGLKPGDQIAFDPPGGNRFASSRGESGASLSGSMN